jgi:Rps23 Pro-64 3,4-dihydroxylase Tpa1-like proline 4-hydroxylase
MIEQISLPLGLIAPKAWPTETFFRLDPENNMLLSFPSSVMHEVLPTYCSSLEFTDGRFTLNRPN